MDSKSSQLIHVGKPEIDAMYHIMFLSLHGENPNPLGVSLCFHKLGSFLINSIKKNIYTLYIDI